ncbi:MAG: hypothetical protein HUU37_01315 [Bdellovibrionales bacterium]|nr:hypothetical protein [Bdellovibrionales bacterium]
MKMILVTLAALIAHPAFALFSPLPAGEARQWQAAYVGETLVDGVRTVAVIEESLAEAPVPSLVASRTLLPGVSEVRKEFRLVLVAAEQPHLRAKFNLVRQTAFVDGELAKVFLSKNNAQGFRFVIRSVGDDRLEATFTREGEASVQQRFEMVPAVQVM